MSLDFGNRDLQATEVLLFEDCIFWGAGEGNGNPLENSVDGGAWWAAVHGVAQSRTRLKQPSMQCRHALEKEMATHSSILAWRIPGTEEPGGLPSMGWHRVGHG